LYTGQSRANGPTPDPCLTVLSTEPQALLIMKRQTIGLGTHTTSTGIYAVAGWGAETTTFTATSYVVGGQPQPHRITELNGIACDLAVSEAPAAVQRYFANRSYLFSHQ
jgi:hypothetical protein